MSRPVCQSPCDSLKQSAKAIWILHPPQGREWIHPEAHLYYLQMKLALILPVVIGTLDFEMSASGQIPGFPEGRPLQISPTSPSPTPAPIKSTRANTTKRMQGTPKSDFSRSRRRAHFTSMPKPSPITPKKPGATVRLFPWLKPLKPIKPGTKQRSG
jgi:hypothetical protein